MTKPDPATDVVLEVLVPGAPAGASIAGHINLAKMGATQIIAICAAAAGALFSCARET